jgi:8-oxo-dGTP pyrophosphatase MutT (NUDIX family)
MTDAPWLHVPPERRRLTVAEVVERCADLPDHVFIRIAETATAPRMATLLLPIVDHQGEAAAVVTKRAATMQFHRDDWVFPGGRNEPGESGSAAAAREAAEELGVDHSSVHVIGQLATRGPIVTGFIIEVFVGVVIAGTLRPDPSEVAEVAILPLSQLASHDVYEVRTTMPDHHVGPIADGTRLPDFGGKGLQHFTIRGGETLWGLQGDVLAELLAHVIR